MQYTNVLGFGDRPGLFGNTRTRSGVDRWGKGGVHHAVAVVGSTTATAITMMILWLLFAVTAHFTDGKDGFVFKRTHLTSPRFQIRKGPHPAAQSRGGRIVVASRTAKAVTEAVVADDAGRGVVIMDVEAVEASVTAVKVTIDAVVVVVVSVVGRYVIDVNPFQIVHQIVNPQRVIGIDTVERILSPDAAFGRSTTGDGSDGRYGGVVRPPLATTRCGSRGDRGASSATGGGGGGCGGCCEGGGGGRRRRGHGVGEIVFALVLHGYNIQLYTMDGMVFVCTIWCGREARQQRRCCG